MRPTQKLHVILCEVIPIIKINEITLVLQHWYLLKGDFTHYIRIIYSRLVIRCIRVDG